MPVIASKEKLAISGGNKAVTVDPGDMFKWPIVTKEDEEAILDVVRRGAMSGNDVSIRFEKEFAQWIGAKHALSYCNGTAALLGAMWGCGVGVGSEVICPSLTYWASAMPALNLGATVNFADIDPDTLCIDPDDIEHRINENTKAILVVHYCGYPCDMDAILAIARRHNVKVIEDVSHAQGALYKGRMTGTLGDVGAMSMMAGKSFAIGEAGMVVTNDRSIWERCIAFGFYERTGQSWYAKDEPAAITDPQLKKYAGLPLGGYKHRINQTCSAMGLVQLKHYPRRIETIQKAMNLFWDRLEGVPGLRAHRPDEDSGSTMGGWYAARGLYRPEELGGLPVAKFCEAVSAEGAWCSPGCNFPLHTHPVLQDADVYACGKPTVLANASRDVRQGPGSLPVSEGILQRAYSIPWFKHYRPRVIRQYADAFRKVAENADQLLSRQ